MSLSKYMSVWCVHTQTQTLDPEINAKNLCIKMLCQCPIRGSCVCVCLSVCVTWIWLLWEAAVDWCSVSLSSPTICFNMSTHCTHAHISDGKAPHSFQTHHAVFSAQAFKTSCLYCLTLHCVVDWQPGTWVTVYRGSGNNVEFTSYL